MKNAIKAVGLTALLAVMIPLSAYADTNTDTPAAADSTAATAQAAPVNGHLHRGMSQRGIITSQNVLDLLKLDPKTLRNKLSQGLTLAQIADQQGVTRDALKQALTDAFTKKQDDAKTKFTGSLDKMVDSKLQAGKKTGGFGSKGLMPMKNTLSAIATQLGIDTDELHQSLKAGKTIADLAAEKGVGLQILIDAEKAAITDQINQAVTDGRLTQDQASKRIAKAGIIAEKIVNGKGFAKGERARHNNRMRKNDPNNAASDGSVSDAQT